MKIHNFAELKAEKEGKITPLALAKYVVELLESGEFEGKELIYVMTDQDDIVRSGWTNTSHLKLLGMLEFAKDGVKSDLEDWDDE